MKIKARHDNKYIVTYYKMHHPRRITKSFNTIKEALDHACTVSEMVDGVDPEILSYVKKVSHRFINKNLELV